MARDLPMEVDDQAPDSDLAGLTTSQSSSRAGSSAGLGLSTASPISAGFGLSSHIDVPEPWVRKLADDGMSYYFANQQTGEISWTVPSLVVSSSHQDRTGRSRAPTTSSHDRETSIRPSRLRSDSSVSRQRSKSSADRLSIHSNVSETFLTDRDPSRFHSGTKPLLINGRTTDWARSNSPERMGGSAGVVELTSAEQSAQLLQQALSAPSPESVTDLSATARQTIMAVIGSIPTTDFTRIPHSDSALDNLVCNVVVAIRNLLYVSAAPSGHIPSHVIPGPRDARDRRDTTASQAQLKPAQRKVTATLSKLVLSARAIQYNSGSSTTDTPIRIEGDAAELDRAVATFIEEVGRSHNQQLHAPTASKRLRGVFSTANIGLGLVGAGAAGTWKGLGWVSLEDTDEAPGRILGTEVVTELRAYMLYIQDMFGNFASSVRELVNESGEIHFSLSTVFTFP